MTATSVNGVAVVSDNPTQSEINTRDGKPILFTQTRTLVLADGSTVYGCQHCDYTSANMGSIRPHLSKHNRRKAAEPPPAATGAVGELIAQLTELGRITQERDSWKDRALTAEKALKKMRSALKSLGVTE